MRTVVCKRCARVRAWLQKQIVTTTASEFVLPAQLAHLSSTGSVSGVKTQDGRHCVLLKTKIGWKENFEGVLCTDQPLLPSEIISSASGHAYISIGDVALFQELYLRRRHSQTCYEVYFDLN